MSSNRQLRLLVCLALVAGTIAIYWPVTHHHFISIDDPEYITQNSHVKAGLTWPGIIWAFTSGDAANWHPLTWISHMLDCQLFGVNSAESHLVNVFFHAADALLLFILLNQLTGAIWRSVFVAALFAWHPLHVESVAWAAERKDVLSAFFWMLTLLAYVRFAEFSKVKNPRSKIFYVLALALFACDLLSKPMVVTLPFVLLLLDFWPLKRVASYKLKVESSSIRQLATDNLRLVIEKIPFFILSAAVSFITYSVQKAGGATWSLSSLPMHTRVENALLAYVRYISKIFWPSDLALIYPYPTHFPIAAVVGAAALLALLTAIFILRAKPFPYLIIGWLWFLGTLVPAIGLVQVGAASMADRYAYLPSIGIFILVAWGLNDFFNSQPNKKKILATAATVALAGCLTVTANQLKYWQNSIALLRHTVAVTPDNYTACNYLGGALETAGLQDDALALYSESVRIEPRFPNSQYSLGIALLRRGKTDEAAEHLGVAAKLVPNDAAIRYYLGSALLASGKFKEAIVEFSAALRLKPDFAAAQRDLAVALVRQNKTAEALPHFAEAARLQPDDAETRFDYGLALLDSHRAADAAAQFSAELKFAPNETSAHYRLAQALAHENKFAQAVQQYREALRLTPDFSDAKKELNDILAAHPELKNNATALDSAK